ncbi:MAG: hypothetical protein ACTHOK_00185 [Nocardioidaceae bacterium]
MTEVSEDVPRSIATLEEFVQLTELRNIMTLRVSGERKRRDVKGGQSAEQEMKVFRRESAETIEVRCVMEVLTSKARLLADIAAIFRSSEPLAVDPGVLDDFTQNVAVMALFPYLRESVQNSAARLGVPPPVLGLLRRGAFDMAKELDGSGPLAVPTFEPDA